MTQEQAQVPLEVVAAITAAIAAYLEKPVGSFAITSIQPAGALARSQTVGVSPAPSAWAKAGLIQAHLARATFGSRNR